MVGDGEGGRGVVSEVSVMSEVSVVSAEGRCEGGGRGTVMGGGA